MSIPWKELQQKAQDELEELVQTWKEGLRVGRFSVAQGQLKDVRSLRVLKKQIAQALTLLQQKKKK